MRIAFDGTTLRPGRTGVGYYTEHLLHHLAAEARDDEVIVMSNWPVDLARPLSPNAWIARDASFSFRLAWLQFGAPRLLHALNADVAHFTNSIVPLASPVPTVVTIHDMSLTLYPRYHPMRRVLLNRPLVRLATRLVDAIITVSHSARRDILRLYDVEPGRVHVVHEAAAPAFRPIADRARLEAVRARYALPERFVLYVGTIEPRKNLPRLVEAYGRRHLAGDLPWPLVCVGRYGWRARDVRARVEQLGLERAIRFAGYVPFDDLPAVYNLAGLFVFPSLHEGFGLPVMEAMACGVPVIVGGNSSLAEIAAGAAETVDATNVEALGDALVSLARSPDRRAELVRRGRARARQFSWRRAARETLEIYRRVARRAETAPAADARPAVATPGIGFEELAARRAAGGLRAPWL